MGWAEIYGLAAVFFILCAGACAIAMTWVMR